MLAKAYVIREAETHVPDRVWILRGVLFRIHFGSRLSLGRLKLSTCTCRITSVLILVFLGFLTLSSRASDSDVCLLLSGWVFTPYLTRQSTKLRYWDSARADETRTEKQQQYVYERAGWYGGNGQHGIHISIRFSSFGILSFSYWVFHAVRSTH